MAVAISVAFIGLGTMGYPMAGHLQKAGHNVTVYNRSSEKAQHWVEQFGGASASTPAKAANNCSVIFICVGNDDDLRDVLLGEEGALSGAKDGAIIVDHTTTSAVIARSIAELCTSSGCGFIDAPVSGGQAGAENARLTVMCGGDQAPFEKAKPFMEAYSTSIKLMGASGAGQLTKMVNQICIAGVVQGLSEGIHFARSAGLDIEAVVEVISKGAAQSWQMDNRHKTMISGDYEHGFAVEWMRKDLGYVLEEARKNGTHLPITALVDQFYSEVEAAGGARWDTSSLLARLENSRKK
jgi:3-hydroxyisobutyrate dehydrogenase-like beta-hydroxyacid dehydrogenase